MLNLYEQIIDESNVTEAYFDVVVRFEQASKTIRYHGVDGISLVDYDLHSLDLIHQVISDLKSFVSVTPALEVHIPKKNKPGTRPVYLHTVRERVRSQAVYRVVEPYFDRYFSKYLFSYRTSHPHHRAIKSVVHRYHQDRPNDYVLVGDISSYSDVLNPTILKRKIWEMGFDEKTNELLFLYVDMPFFRKGRYMTHDDGIITGLPVTVLFNNLYLNDFDKEFGEQSGMYRRVGDDFLAFGTQEELARMQKQMQERLREVAIADEFQKISIHARNEIFGFLGFQFNNGTISVLAKSILNIQKRMRYLLRYRHFSKQEERINKLEKILFDGGGSIRRYFIELIRHYNHVNDQQQIAWLSEYFFVRLTMYFFGKYSPRNWRKTKELLHGIEVPSLLRYYTTFQTGKLRGDNFKNIR